MAALNGSQGPALIPSGRLPSARDACSCVPSRRDSPASEIHTKRTQPSHPHNMASPSPKRRRTSPETEVTDTGDFRPRNALRRTPPRRASWLSPTKASMARFNPEILARRASAVSATAELAGQTDPSGQGQRALAYVLGESQQHSDRQEAQAGEQDEGQRRQSIGGSRKLPSRDVLQAAAAENPRQETAQSNKRMSVAEDDLPTHPVASPAARPDLPPQKGLFSSPSKLPRRNRSLGQRLSSPFKPRESPLRLDPPASEAEAEAGADEPSPTPRGQIQEPSQVVEASAVEQGPTPAEPKKDVPDPRRVEKERLQKQLQELQEEVKLYEREIERSRSLPGDDRGEDISALLYVLKPSTTNIHANEFSSLVNKANPSPPVSKPEAPPLSSLLSAFLPLAKPISLPTPPPEEAEKPLPSHEPIELDDPLPYLRLFTSFDYSSKMEVGQEPGHQTHFISMRSPSSLLHLDLNLTADATSQSISKLAIRSVSPWASHELGRWIAQRAARNDVGGVCWAAESYYDLAVKRATCWARCYRELGRLLKDAPGDKTAKSSAKRSGQRKDAQPDVPPSSNLLEEEAEEVSGIGSDLTVREQDGRPISRAELLHGLGRDGIVLRSKEVLFRVSWKIQFDWTGEAESVVGADAAVPGVCEYC